MAMVQSIPYASFQLRTAKFRSRRWLFILAHVLFWCCYIFLPLLIIQPNDNRIQNTPLPTAGPQHFYEVFFFINFVSILIFYANSQWLIPHFFKLKNYAYYAISTTLLLGMALTVNYLFRYWLNGTAPKTFFTFTTFYLFMSVLGISACYRILSDFQQEQRVESEREKVRLQSELSFLRSQISPHFMFNLMNSLASLARKKSDLMEPMIVKMSDLLRYMLYDSDEAKVPIDKEINYLNNYVDLQKMRFGDYVTVTTEVNIQNHRMALEPMLLIPFIENAFKHGTGLMRNPLIEISLRTDEQTLHFMVRNKFNGALQDSKDNSSGIGLANVRRRMELLYPNRHELTIRSNEGWFECSLRIVLS
jgi:two-component system, LytTR family, sensor kinase